MIILHKDVGWHSIAYTPFSHLPPTGAADECAPGIPGYGAADPDHVWGRADNAVVEIDADVGGIVTLRCELAAAFRLTVKGVSLGW
jgi:hypothetical protein